MRTSEDVVWCPVEGEIVLFNSVDGKYFGLDDVAARIWSRVSEGATADEIVATLLDEFEVDEPVARQETNELLAELTELRLLVDN